MDYSDVMIADPAQYQQPQHHHGMLDGEHRPQPQHRLSDHHQPHQHQHSHQHQHQHQHHSQSPQPSDANANVNVSASPGLFAFSGADPPPQTNPFAPDPPYHDPQHDSFANLTNPPAPAPPSEQAIPPQQIGQPPPEQPQGDPQFDIFDWYPKYQSCQRYFVSHAQHSAHVQAVAAFINIRLPHQHPSHPVHGSPPRSSPPTILPQPILGGATPEQPPHRSHSAVSLTPYLRRLVVTGLDYPGVLHGFFGDDWASGVGPLHEQERRNYLFAAKSGGWAVVKRDYDGPGEGETVPFLRPLQGVVVEEIEAAERGWSEWLAMEDWMVGPRAPMGLRGTQEQGRTDGRRHESRGEHHPQQQQQQHQHQQNHPQNQVDPAGGRNGNGSNGPVPGSADGSGQAGERDSAMR